MIARRLGMVSPRAVVLAPRGEFSEGALKLKAYKKNFYIFWAKSFGLYRNIIWHASTEHEAEDIKRVMGSSSCVMIARNISAVSSAVGNGFEVRGDGQPLRVVFLSRISPKKNLKFALEVLRSVKVPVKFEIYGPIEDQQYWGQCVSLVKDLPENICVEYMGAVDPSEIGRVMASNDLFFLPTLGENFGHVIAEAITAGTPVLISDTTPWRNLEGRSVGRDIPLSEGELFVEYIEYFYSLDSGQQLAFRDSVHRFAEELRGDDSVIENNLNLFRAATHFKS